MREAPIPTLHRKPQRISPGPQIWEQDCDLGQVSCPIYLSSVQFSSVTHWCPILHDPMDCSTSGFSVHHQCLSFLKLISIELVMPSNCLILCHPFFSCPQSFPASGSFPISQLFASYAISVYTSISGYKSNSPQFNKIF